MVMTPRHLGADLHASACEVALDAGFAIRARRA
jgi:hypothetical protein